MAKAALVQRELKRERLVEKYLKRRLELKKIINNNLKFNAEDCYNARLALQKLPRNANPTRRRNRCFLTGRSRGTFRYFGLCRIKVREMAFAGNIPGIVKASW